MKGIEPETSHSVNPCLYYYANCTALIVSTLYMSLIEKAFIRRIKKPVLNPTLTLTPTLVLRAKHNDAGISRVGPALPGHSLRSNPSSPQTHLHIAN